MLQGTPDLDAAAPAPRAADPWEQIVILQRMVLDLEREVERRDSRLAVLEREAGRARRMSEEVARLREEDRARGASLKGAGGGPSPSRRWTVRRVAGAVRRRVVRLLRAGA